MTERSVTARRTDCKGQKETFGGGGYVLISVTVLVMRLYTFATTHQIVHL